MIKGILFDFDGTIVDSERSRLESINKVLEKYDINISETDWVNKYLKLNTKPIFEQILKENDIQGYPSELYKESHKLRKLIVKKEGVDLIPNFVEFYDFCKEHDVKMIICSGGKKEFIDVILDKMKLKDIESFGRESYHNPKPAPDAYLKGLEILGLQPDEVAVFDDSYHGLLSAKNAKIRRFISINSQNPKVEDLNPYMKVKDYRDFNFEKVLELENN